ncbi:MAG TPA: hypothetical protein VJ183_08350 [Chloroflexia bacterium]|nr:hypothetical protein [Chloroflexia bacterium]
MAVRNELSEIETRCMEIMNSPYVRREIPSDLEKLRTLLLKVRRLAHDDVPGLIAEVKRLRSLNKRLEESAAVVEMSLASQQLSGPQ